MTVRMCGERLGRSEVAQRAFPDHPFIDIWKLGDDSAEKFQVLRIDRKSAETALKPERIFRVGLSLKKLAEMPLS